MVGDRIKTLRVFKKLTQDELVDGIASIAYLSKVENGQTKPSEQFLYKIAEKLGIEPEVLSNPSSLPDIEERVRQILFNYWKKKILSDSDITFLKLLSAELQSNKVLLMVFAVLIRFFYSHSRLVEAREAYTFSKRVVKIHEDKSDGEETFYYVFACGVLHFELYEFHSAHTYFLQAKGYLPEDDREKARVYYNLSLVNERINIDKTVCLKYSERAYEFMKRTGDANRTVNILLVRAIQFLSINKPNEALECTFEAQNLVSLTDSDPRLKSSIVYSFGRVYQMKGDYTESIKYYNEFIMIVKDQFPEKVTKGYKRLAEIHIHLKEWEAAGQNLELAQTVAKEYKKVFFDKEIKLLEIFTYKIKQLDDKYEKEMQRLLTYCIKHEDLALAKYLASELGVYFHERQAYKKASSFLKQAYDIEKKQKSSDLQMIEGWPFEF
jgi:HTH-type transcriptional regulator, quorum sensing regulator NprR